MARAIGLVELTTVSTGFKAADDMSKAADVEILQAEVTCPGKFVVLIAGDLSAVRASVDSVKGRYGDKVIDHFVLGNPHDSIFPAIYGTLAKGMCGKSYMTLTGSVSAVQAAIDRAKAEAADRGMFLDSSVIARPSDKLVKYIM